MSTRQKKLIVVWLSLGIIFVFFTLQGFAQESSNKEREIEGIIKGLENSELKIKKGKYLEKLLQIINEGYWSKIEIRQQERIKNAFIITLKEGVILAEKIETIEGTKYLELLGIIAGRLRDPRSISILIEGMPFSWFEKALVEIGEPAIESLLKILKEGVGHQKSGSLRVFKEMYKQGKVKGKNIKKIKQEVIKACQDDMMEVRISGLHTISEFEDGDVIPLIESIAKTDPEVCEIDASFRGGEDGKKIKIYPVREEAQRVIKLLEEKKKQKENEGKKAPKGKKELQEGVNDKKGKK